MMAAAMMILPGIDAIAKFLADQLSAGQIAWGRFFFQALYLFVFVALRDSFRVDRNLWKHVARGCLIAFGTVCFFFAVGRMPMADTMAIFFVEPLILTLLAPLFLEETVGWRRITAVIAGLAGSLVIIQPTFQVFGLVTLLPVAAATAFALYIILTRSLTRDTGTFSIMFYAGVFGGLSMSLALWIGTETSIAFLTFVMPTSEQWIWLAGLAAIATLGHMLIVLAVKRIGASMIAPFQYLEIISATALGFAIFGDFPQPFVWIGVAIIIMAGLYVFFRERRLASG